MKKSLFLILICFSLNTFAQHWEWVKQPSNTTNTELHFAAGTNRISYLSACAQYLSSQVDCHLTRQLNGDPVWDKNFGRNMQIKNLVITGTGDILLVGNFKDTIVINGTQMISAGHADAFLFKLDSLGQTIWLKTFAGSNDDVCNDVYLDPTGNIFVTGSLSNNAIVDGISYPSKGLFIGKFDSSGSLLHMIRSTTGGQGLKVKSDSLNNIYVMGTVLYDTLLLDTVVAYPPYYYYANNFVTKFDMNGNYKGFVGIGNGATFAMERSGTFYILENSYYNSSSLRQYSSALVKNWQKNYAGCTAACLNSKQEICVTGSVYNYVDSTNSYYWKYDRNGNLLDEAGTQPHQYIGGRLITMDDEENMYIIGNCSPSTDFGNIHLNLNSGQSYFMGKIKGKKPYADFSYKQPYEVQTVCFKNLCLNDTALRWIFPGGTPSISTEKDPIVSYATAGNKVAILIAFNGFSSDTMFRQFTIRPEPIDTIYVKTLDQANWSGGSTPLYNKTSDGGFVVGWPGIYKFNKNGSLQWQTSSAFGYYPGYITEVPNGYVTLSNSMTLLGSNSGVERPLVKKTDLHGNMIWAKDYKDQLLPNACSTTGFGLCASYEGGFIFGGSSVVKSDSIGNILWQYIYPLASTNILQHTNGTYIVQGLKYLNGVNNSFVAQINGDGTLNWMKGYDNTGNANINNTIVCKNKDIVITGNLGNTNSQESYVLRLDSAGNLKWAKTYKAGEFWIMGVADVGNGKLMVSCNFGGWSMTRQIVVMLLDQNGDLVWNRSTNVNDMSMNHGILSHGDGHAFLLGTRNQYNIIARLNLLPPPCLPDSITINCSTRLVSLLTTTVQIDTMHYSTTDAYSYQPVTSTPLIPSMQCTGNGGFITDILNEKINTIDELSIFPNPSTGAFIVKNKSLGAKVSVLDVMGNYVIDNVSLQNNEEHFDLGKAAKGIYFVEIITNNQKTVKKISLQ